MAAKERYVRQADLERLAWWEPERTKSGLYVFYKVVRGKSRGSPIYYPKQHKLARAIFYLDGEVITEKDANQNAMLGCAAGLSVLAHAPSRSGYYRSENRNALLLQVLVREGDIACVPSCSARIFGQYKLRVRKLLVVGIIKEENFPREKLAEGWKWPLTWKGSLKEVR